MENNNEQVTQPEQQAPAREINYPQINNVPENENGNLKWIILIILVLVALGVLGWFIFSKSSTPVEEPAPLTDEITQETPAPLVTATPTSTPVSTVFDRAKITIKVMNGTGVSGEAGYLQTILKGLGYTQVTVGNAPSQDAVKTTATFSATLAQGAIDEISAKLRAIYTQVEVKTSQTVTSDVEIITGLRKGATAKPSSTPTVKPSASPSASSTPTVTPTATP